MTWMPQTFQEWAPSSFEPEPEEKSLKEGIIPRLVAGALAVGQGGLPVFDEAGAYIGEKLGVGGDIPYEKRLENIRGTEKAFSKEYPATDVGLRLAGAIGATAPMAGSLAARPFLSGASYGGAQGFLGADGGLGNRASSGIAGASIGGIGGVVADRYLAPLASSIGSTKPALKIKGRELSKIEENLSNAGISKGQYAANLLRSSSDDFAGELGGEPLRAQTQAQAKWLGPAMQTARDAMRARLAQAPERAKVIVQSVLGPDDESKALLDALGVAEGAEKTLYGAVEGAIKSSDIQDVLNTPAGQSALKATAEKLANARIDPLKAGFVQKDGVYSFADEVPTQTIHELSKSLGDLVKRNPNTGAIEDSAGTTIERLRSSLVDKLKASDVEFRAAQENAAQTRAAQQAYSHGRGVAKKTTGEQAEDIMEAALRRDEYAPFAKAGFKQGLYDAMENVPLGTGNPIARIAQERTASRIGDIAGSGSAEAFRKQVMAEKLRMELANRGLYGSNTAESLATNLQNIPMTKTSLLDRVLTAVSEKITKGSNERLTKALYATSPEEKQALASYLMGQAPESAKRSAMVEFLRNTTPALPAQSGMALLNRREQ